MNTYNTNCTTKTNSRELDVALLVDCRDRKQKRSLLMRYRNPKVSIGYVNCPSHVATENSKAWRKACSIMNFTLEQTMFDGRRAIMAFCRKGQVWALGSQQYRFSKVAKALPLTTARDVAQYEFRH